MAVSSAAQGAAGARGYRETLAAFLAPVSAGGHPLAEEGFLALPAAVLAERCNGLIESGRRSPRRDASQAVESFIVFFQALVPTLAPEGAAGKSVIPCLEPCAVLLEFARKAARWEQADRSTLALAAEEMETVQEALRLSLDQPLAGAREADFSQPLNPRRVRWILSRLDDLSRRDEAEKEGD